MPLLTRQKIVPFIPHLQLLCVLGAFGCTGLLLAKLLYFGGWAAKQETIVYSLPLVFLLFIWARYKLGEEELLHWEVFLIDSLAILLAASRLLALFFHSGHVLFLLYTYITTPHRVYRLLCLPMILVTAYFKVIYWGDFITPFIGAVLAMVLIECRAWAIAKVKCKNRV